MTQETPFKHIAIISVGLIGGSLAKVIKHQFPTQQILGISGNKSALDKAIADQTIDNAQHYDDPIPTSVDLIIVCSPINHTVSIIQKMEGLMSQNY